MGRISLDQAARGRFDPCSRPRRLDRLKRLTTPPTARRSGGSSRLRCGPQLEARLRDGRSSRRDACADRDHLREAWEVWIDAARRGEIRNRNRRAYKPAALRSYDNDMKLYVLAGFGARRLADIRADDLQGLVDRLIGNGLSGSRVRNVVVPLQALYRRHRREVPVNPTRDLDLPEAGGVREWHGTPTDAHAKLAALPVGERAVWATAFFAGLRRGELRALRVRDIQGLEDGTEAYIDVVRSWDDMEYASFLDAAGVSEARADRYLGHAAESVAVR